VHATRLSSAPLADLVSPSRPTVFVVDDDVSVREFLQPLMALEGWRVEVFASAQDFLSHPRMTAPNCLVLDMAIPDTNGLEVQRLVADRLEMPVIFIAGYADVPIIVRAMKAGAVEFLMKPISPSAILAAVRQALARSEAVLDRSADIMSLRRRYALLSGREREVVHLVVSGWLNKQVGVRLGISEVTVKAHRAKVMRKMQADSLAELVNMFMKLGVVSE
jgi:FixJ family two-component response regulator